MLTDSPLLALLLVVMGLLFLLLLVAVIIRRRRGTAAKKSTKKSAKPAKKKPIPGKSKQAAAPAPPAKSQPKPQAPAVASSAQAGAPPDLPSPALKVQVEPGDKVRILVVDDNPETRDHVSRLLYFEKDMEVIGQAVNGRQGIEMAVAYKPHIVLMDINMPDMDGIAATHEVGIQAPYSQVIIMTVQAEAHYMKQAMAAGARDFQPKPFTSDELINCVRRVYNIGLPIYRRMETAEQVTVEKAAGRSSPGTTADHEPGRVIALFSPKGGIGVTTLATNLAVALQQLYGDVALMDADLPFGDALVHLNTRPTRTISDMIHDGELDIDLLADVLLPHNSGLKLLLAPPQPELADAVLSAMLPPVIKALRRQFKFVLVDTYHKLDDKMMAVLEHADYILLITDPELPAIKSAKLVLELGSQLGFGPNRLGVLINRADQPGGVSPAKIEKILRIDHTFRIPYDPRILLAINRGVIVTQQDPNSPIAQALTNLAQELNDSVAALAAVGQK